MLKKILEYVIYIINLVMGGKLEDLERKPEPEPEVKPKPDVKPVPEPEIKKFSTEQEEMLRLINAFRAKEDKKLVQLELNEELCGVAQEHTDWMEKKKALSHKGFDDRANQYGLIAENVAMGDRDSVGIFEMWRNSKGHRINMLSNGKELGVGYKDGWWTTVFR